MRLATPSAVVAVVATVHALLIAIVLTPVSFAARIIAPTIGPVYVAAIGSVVASAFTPVPVTIDRPSPVVITLAPRRAPTIALAIEGPASVVGVPVAVDREAHNWQTNARTIFDHAHASAIVEIGQLVAGHPAARITPTDIAPTVGLNAAVDVHADIGRDPIHHRKVVRGTGTQIGSRRRHRISCRSEVGTDHQPGSYTG